MSDIGELECTLESTLFDTDNNFIFMIKSIKGESNSAKRIAQAIRQGLSSGKERLIVAFKWHKEKRSLNANAYFHVLVDKIAKAIGIGTDECKRRMVLDYGAVAKDEHGDKVGFKLPASVDVSTVYKYAKKFDTRKENGKAFHCYIIYAKTSTYNKTEMKRLVDGTVNEAKNLDIETKTPKELAELYSLWGSEK